MITLEILQKNPNKLLITVNGWHIPTYVIVPAHTDLTSLYNNFIANIKKAVSTSFGPQTLELNEEDFEGLAHEDMRAAVQARAILPKELVDIRIANAVKIIQKINTHKLYSALIAEFNITDKSIVPDGLLEATTLDAIENLQQSGPSCYYWLNTTAAYAEDTLTDNGYWRIIYPDQLNIVELANRSFTQNPGYISTIQFTRDILHSGVMLDCKSDDCDVSIAVALSLECSIDFSSIYSCNITKSVHVYRKNDAIHKTDKKLIDIPSEGMAADEVLYDVVEESVAYFRDIKNSATTPIANLTFG